MVLKTMLIGLAGTWLTLAAVAQTAAPEPTATSVDAWIELIKALVAIVTLLMPFMFGWLALQQAKLKSKVDANDVKTDALGTEQKEIKEGIATVVLHTNSMTEELQKAAGKNAKAELLADQKALDELREQHRNEFLREQAEAKQAGQAAIVPLASVPASVRTAGGDAKQPAEKLAGIVPIGDVEAIIVDSASSHPP